MEKNEMKLLKTIRGIQFLEYTPPSWASSLRMIPKSNPSNQLNQPLPFHSSSLELGQQEYTY